MHYSGVDLQKTNFVVCFLTAEGKYRVEVFSLTEKGGAAFARRVTPEDVLAVEAAGNVDSFYDRVRAWVKEVVVVNPYQFALIARSQKKTDKHDAVTLARVLQLGWFPQAPVPSEPMRELRVLLAARQQLVERQTKLRTMGHAALGRNGIAKGRGAFASARSRPQLTQLAEDRASSDGVIVHMGGRQLQALEQEMERGEEESVRRGRALPGIERVLQGRGFHLLTAIGLLAEMGDIAWFTHAQQVVAYAGLAPSVRQSGAVERHGKLTGQGRRRLRTVVMRAVLTLAKGPRTPLLEFYEKKKREKGAGKALCATARKLLTIMFVMLKKELDYWYLEDPRSNRKLRLVKKVAA